MQACNVKHDCMIVAPPSRTWPVPSHAAPGAPSVQARLSAGYSAQRWHWVSIGNIMVSQFYIAFYLHSLSHRHLVRLLPQPISHPHKPVAMLAFG